MSQATQNFKAKTSAQNLARIRGGWFVFVVRKHRACPP